MGLSLRAGAGRELVPVRPRPGRPLTVYVCGPTVYDAPHVGHARTYLLFDTARRQIESAGRRVRFVMNITDYEDKISDRAAATGRTWRGLARAEEALFRTDLRTLRVEPPDVSPRASDHVAEMRRAIQRLERTARVVRRDGGLYFRPRPEARSTREAADRARRHLVREGPGGPPDGAPPLEEFALWLPPHPGGPAWPSPWGRGSPGWHIECYVMARRYTGLPVDLHGGGRDLVYPHHFAETELARALDRRPFARNYLYSNFVTQDGVKMSKSTGQLVPLREALEAAGADALRWYLLSTHYSKPLEWAPDGLARARDRFESVRRSLVACRPDGAGGALEVEELRGLVDQVGADLERDLRSDRAIDRLTWFSERIDRESNGRFPRGSGREVRRLLALLEARLGLRFGRVGA